MKLYGYFWELIHQNLGANFGVPKSSYRSQKRPVLSPGLGPVQGLVGYLAIVFLHI